ncbi:NACHT domain-containing protein [Fusarium sp. Ph1]|nr:NACHT domain-containing protein [Fusarium sp. Ph1]
MVESSLLSTLGTLDNIVPRESTSFGLPGKHENVVSLQASHGGVCKFGTSLQDRDNFKLVQANIQDLYDNAIANDQDQLEQNLKMMTKPEQAIQIIELLRSTCEWFTSHDRFQDWKDGKTCGLLWVSADPGCGQSVLSRCLVDEVLQSSSTSTTCYFFFKDDFQDQKSAAVALCCVLRQLFDKKRALLENSILKQFKEAGDKLFNSFRQLWRILVSVSARHGSGQIVCILDALDECEEQDRLLLVETLKDFYLEKGTNTNLKFLVTSRSYVNIERGFHDIQTKLPVIRLQGEGQSESEKIAREIDLVVEARITQLCEKLHLTKAVEEVMKRGMTQHPNRTYLWVYLVFGELENCVGHSSKQMKEHIGNIPATVDKAYEKILSRSPDKNKARKLLRIVVAAKRPLTLKEIAAAVAIEKRHTSYSQLDIDGEEQLRTWIRELCGLFVSIVDDKIYLLHQTAAEFLVETVEDRESQKDHLKEDKARYEWKGSFSPGSSNLILGSVCAQILLLTDVVGDVGKHFGAIRWKTLMSLELLDKKYPLLSYSVEHWVAHLRDARSTKDLPLSDMLQLCSGSESACLVRVPCIRGKEFYVRTKDLTALVTASILGLEAVARHLLKLESTDANQGGPIFELPPLSWAVMGGHRAVFDRFIEAEARYQKTVHRLKRLFRRRYVDLDVRNKSLYKSLSEPFRVHCARRGGHTTPLGWAVCYGEAYMVRMLLATRRVAVAKEMLCEAAMNDCEDIIRVLLATDQVTVDCRDSPKRTPLSYAVERGHERIVQQLLATGKADVNFMDSLGETPLHYAAGRGYEGVMQQLLATGKANVDAKDSEGSTALALAAQRGEEGVVRKLLATGKVDVNSIDRDGETILAKAIQGMDHGTIEALLETGRVIITPDCWTSAHWRRYTYFCRDDIDWITEKLNTYKPG